MRQHYLLTRELETKLERLIKLNSLTRKTTTTLSVVPGGSPNPHSREEIIVAAADLSEEIKKDIINLIKKEKDMTEIIDSIKDEQSRIILEKRCFLHKSWEDIANDMGVSERKIYDLKPYAEMKLIEVLQNLQ